MKAAANEDDDLDKLLAEIEGRQGKAAPAEAVAPAAAAPDGAAPDAAANAEADGGNEAADAEAESEGKVSPTPAPIFKPAQLNYRTRDLESMSI